MLSFKCRCKKRFKITHHATQQAVTGPRNNSLSIHVIQKLANAYIKKHWPENSPLWDTRFIIRFSIACAWAGRRVALNSLLTTELSVSDWRCAGVSHRCLLYPMCSIIKRLRWIFNRTNWQQRLLSILHRLISLICVSKSVTCICRSYEWKINSTHRAFGWSPFVYVVTLINVFNCLIC